MSKKVKGRMGLKKQACDRCHKLHSTCDMQWPCGRCAKDAAGVTAWEKKLTKGTDLCHFSCRVAQTTTAAVAVQHLVRQTVRLVGEEENAEEEDLRRLEAEAEKARATALQQAQARRTALPA